MRLGSPDSYEALITDRTLRTVVGVARWSGLDYERLLNGTSAGNVTIPAAFTSSVADTIPWKHGLVFRRNGIEEWGGPIVTARRAEGSEDVVLSARDRLHWMTKRFLVESLEFKSAELAVMAAALIADGTARDNPFRLTADEIIPCFASQARSLKGNSGVEIFSALQDLSRSGLDFTMFRDRLIGGRMSGRGTVAATLFANSFMSTVGIELDGGPQSNSEMVAGSGSGGSGGFSVSGAYEAWTTEFGLLQSFSSDSNLTRPQDCVTAASHAWDRFHDTPVVVSCPPLRPDAPITTDLLTAGIVIRLSLNDPVFPSADGDYRLESVKFSATIDAKTAVLSESITPSLVRITG